MVHFEILGSLALPELISGQSVFGNILFGSTGKTGPSANCFGPLQKVQQDT